MDIFSVQKRSDLMSRIRSKNTKPELRLRSALHRIGFRYRLHGKGLPGKPDLIFPGRRTVVFVHGCFWHGHTVCGKAHIPQTNRDFWEDKLTKNILRDSRKASELRDAGWNVIVVWECEIMRDPQETVARLAYVLRMLSKIKSMV